MIRTGSQLLATLALAITVSVSGCASKKKKAEEESMPTTENAHLNIGGDSDSGQAAGLQTINFEYDSFALTSEAKSILAKNIQILKDKPSINIQIEGHCDERGGIQYNIALGERRANSVRNYMADAGVARNRISTISFGKERPLDTGSSEAAWAKNRRANFVITSK